MKKWIIGEPVFEADFINEKLAVAPWEGHRRFAYDFLSFMQPERIVELGTHYGCSFFAFCQSAKDQKLNTDLFAIDTWQGDEQAGFYSEEVFDKVNEVVNAKFINENIHLIRKTFDEALTSFEDNSIDIIHIDGLHTYEAVSHDYNTWLPKLKENGVVLFHDVYSKLDYGSDYFWAEIKEQYPHYEFKHSWGLGILFPKGDRIYKELLEQNFEDKIYGYTYRSLFEFEKIKTNDLSFMVSERDKAIKSNELLIAEKDKSLATAKVMIESRDEAIKTQEKMIEERDTALIDADKMIKERDLALSNAEKMIDERDKALLNSENLIKERDLYIQSLERIANEKENQIVGCQDKLSDAKQQQNVLEQQIDANISRMDDLIIELEKERKKVEYYESKKIILNFRKKDARGS